MIDLEDTIVAIASPTTPAARGVVRISGNQTTAILNRLGVTTSNQSSSHRFSAGIDVGPPIGRFPIDVLHWPTTRSYTGQPSAELHTFGSLPILESIVGAVIDSGGRAARPGEFTLRAFLAGRLDLTQAEAVLGVIEAEGRGSLDHALRQLSGNLAAPINEMRSTILNLLADVEAGLDFVDEDIEFISDETLIDGLTEIETRLTEIARTTQSRGGGAARPTVVLRGHPNAGKSTLLNRLAGDEVAIVTDIAGTTRDAVMIEADIEGHSVTLVDTAGIENADSEIESRSQAQAARAGRQSLVRLWCVDHSQADYHQTIEDLEGIIESDRRPGVIDLWVMTKSDQPQVVQTSDQTAEFVKDRIHCSAMTGVGIDELQSRIVAAVGAYDAEQVGSVIGTAARCRQSIDQACQSIAAAIELTAGGDGHEFVSAELRRCADALGEVTGAVYTDDILDRVFSRFCIGK